MTDQEYMDKTRSFHIRLGILQKQIGDHFDNKHPTAINDAVIQIYERMSELCKELAALDKEFWGDA